MSHDSKEESEGGSGSKGNSGSEWDSGSEGTQGARGTQGKATIITQTDIRNKFNEEQGKIFLIKIP